jgi:hypothetical protein
MSVSPITFAKGAATTIAAISGLVSLRCVFSGVCGGAGKLLSGEFAEVASPMLSFSNPIIGATAVAVTALGVRLGLGKFFPEPKQP